MSTLEEVLEAARAAEAATLWDVAAERYEECLTMLAPDDASGAADLLTPLGRCYWNLSEARTAWRTLRRAIALYRDRGDAAGTARATLEILRIWGPPDRQRTMAQEALDLVGDSDPHARALLLLRMGQWDDALLLADQHDLADVKVARTERAAWQAFDDGRIDEGAALLREAHRAYAQLGEYRGASHNLRGLAFRVLESGRLKEGMGLAREATDYARSMHLRFNEQLALMDLVGAAFARADFAGCEALLGEVPGATDFRADLYRMWIAELRGDIPAAMALMVDPERGGGAPTAMSQTHCAAAGMLHHAGRLDAAGVELRAWAEVAGPSGSFCEEAPAIADCLVALGDDDLLQRVHDAFEQRPAWSVYATLQGRADHFVRGAVALRLGHAARAVQHFTTGQAWAERESCPIDAGRCLQGRASAALASGDKVAAHDYLHRARAVFAAHGAQLYIDQVDAARAAP